MYEKMDTLFSNLNTKYDAVATHVKKLETQVTQTMEAVKRQEAESKKSFCNSAAIEERFEDQVPEWMLSKPTVDCMIWPEEITQRESPIELEREDSSQRLSPRLITQESFLSKKKRSYNQKSEDCPDGSIENSAQPRSPAGRGTHVPRSAKTSVRLKSRPKSKTTRPITHHDPGNKPAVGHATTATPRRARPKRASRETSLAAAQLARVPADAPSEPGKNVPRPAERFHRPNLSADRNPSGPTVPTRPQPDCPADRPARPSQRRGRPEALFEAQTYVFKPGLTLSRL
ncbi:unnamed protein product [Microthlaspi erraticum]|uniref:Uncharacterized protein n=1 Tax=Microthlaspi erraticum TaxID=1685480 RepID=A0A6D2IQW7_9BRAS|nr:unnamed protein product [Microthlaspi erraticum]